jgi:hypothetical protein
MQLYTVDATEDRNALLSYADNQWPHAQLWVAGSNGTHCQTVSNINKANFEVTSVLCSQPFFFYCQYKGKELRCNQGNLIRILISSVHPKFDSHHGASGE